MSVKTKNIGSSYILNLPHTPSNKLSSVEGKEFFSALKVVFGRKHVVNTIKWFASHDESSEGIRDFNGRIQASLTPGNRISVDDQKYLADVVHKVSIGVFDLKF